MEQIEASNAKAVIRSRAGNHKEAVRHFQESLREIRHLSRNVALETYTEASFFTMSTLTLPTNSSGPATNSHIVFYNRLFLLDGLDMGHEVTPETLEVATAAIFYNMGATFHDLVTRGQDKHAIYAQKAYEHALDILERLIVSSSIIEFGLLTMAVLNNQAHLNSICFETNVVSNRMGYLMGMLQRVLPMVHLASPTQRVEVDFFCTHSVLYKNHPHFSTAAAA